MPASARTRATPSVDETAEAGATVLACTADAVVLDLDHEPAVLLLRTNSNVRRPRVLDRVGDRLANDEVGRRLDLSGQPVLRGGGDLDGKRRARGERLERSAEPLLGQDLGMHPARQLAELLDRDLQLGDGVGEHTLELGIALRQLTLCDAQLERQRHEPLLGPIVQVALDPATLLVAGGDDPAPRLLHLVELRANVCLQPGVVQRKPRGGARRLDQAGVQLGVVHDRGDVVEPGDRAAVRGQVGRSTGFVDVDAPHRQPVGNLQRVVVERPCKRVADLARRDVRELDDEVGDGAPGELRSQQPGEQREWHCDLAGDLPPVETV
jgi:hypothetical protein